MSVRKRDEGDIGSMKVEEFTAKCWKINSAESAEEEKKVKDSVKR